MATTEGGIDRQALAVQRFYPQIYFACHRRHVRAASSATRLSGRDAGILAHLDLERSTSATELGRHLSVTASTLTAAIDRLEELGYVERSRNFKDRRRVGILLTVRGARAMARSSVLETPRVRRLLARLTTAERRRAVEGLSLLAKAALEHRSST